MDAGSPSQRVVRPWWAASCAVSERERERDTPALPSRAHASGPPPLGPASARSRPWPWPWLWPCRHGGRRTAWAGSWGASRHALSLLHPKAQETRWPGSPPPTHAGQHPAPPAIGSARSARPFAGRISASSFEKTRARLCDFTHCWSESRSSCRCLSSEHNLTHRNGWCCAPSGGARADDSSGPLLSRHTTAALACCPLPAPVDGLLSVADAAAAAAPALAVREQCSTAPRS